MKKAVVSVINDLVTDQRVHKTCLLLKKSGFEVTLVGRLKRNSPELDFRPYHCHRMRLIFEKGPLFYAEFNLRLFFFLILRSYVLYFSNDLDTLLPNFIIARLKGKKLVYDSHEYFTETPELINRKLVQSFWRKLEEFLLPGLDGMITVNESIAGLFREKYHIRVEVVRNIPPRYQKNEKLSRVSMGLPEQKKILVMQGSGINMHRGAEELVRAMEFLPDCHLLLIGGGDVWDQLKILAEQIHVDHRIQFLDRMPYAQMMIYTSLSDLGLSLDKPTSINYRLSLPNKLFDYMQAGIPVLASRLPELEKIITTYQIGDFADDHQPRQLASKINEIVSDENKLKTLKHNATKAAGLLNWENEQLILLNFLGVQHG